ncbi:hypothetical protein OAT16_11765 [Prolixibacteraceae bacterium]|nr:hypothetical protein [Prolixibacteraceae bacterium]
MKNTIIIISLILLCSCASWDNRIIPYAEAEHDPALIGKWIPYSYAHKNNKKAYVTVEYLEDGVCFQYSNKTIRKFWRSKGNTIISVPDRGRRWVNTDNTPFEMTEV